MPSKPNRLILALTLIVFVSLTCNKRAFRQTAPNQELLSAARQFFADSIASSGPALTYRASLNRQPLWEQATTNPLSQGIGISIPIVYVTPILVKANFAGPQFFHIDYLTRLWIVRDTNGTFTGRVITDFPDTNYFKNPTRPFTGIRFVEDWQGRPVEKLLYAPDGSVSRYTPQNKQPDAVTITQTCYTIEGYNYSPGQDEVYAWTENAGCSIDFSFDRSDGGGGAGAPGGAGSGAGPGSASRVAVLPGNSVIKSIKNYLQCFTNVGGSDHTYTVTVCVDQPDPGTRTPWTFSSGGSSGTSGGGNPINTGHTFLIFTETYASTTITRNIGFYPSGIVTPGRPSSPGQLNDDENHYYNVSGTFTLDNAQFFNMLNFITEASTGTYNLNTNNCSTFAINTLTEGNIQLPRTEGTWPGGAGNDPGDLGQDIKNSNIPGMALNTTAGYSKGNAGQCN